MFKALDLTNQKFGRLTAISPSHSVHNVGVYWNCICECGKSTSVPAGNLRCGNTKSCGCLKIEKFLARTRKKFGESSFNMFVGRYKETSKKRGLSFELSLDEFRALTSSNCFYCGALPDKLYSHKRSYGAYAYNGIDRVDNDKGYTLDNCVPCCRICNFMKHSQTQEAFLSKVKEIYMYKIEEK